jgi:glycosyltransferase involved in cell wall biosynthesis
VAEGTFIAVGGYPDVNTILSINASLHVRGGADRFFTELNRLMLDKGESVVTFTYRPVRPVDNAHPRLKSYFIDRILYPEGVWKKITGIVGVFYSRRIMRDLEAIIEKEKPAVAHVHNIYHRIPYGIIDVLKKHGVKTVWWLHDYKWICPNHQLYTQGSLCKRCVNGRYMNAMLHRCQLESLYKSAIVTAFAYFVDANGFRDKVDRFIAPSQSVFTLFREFGFPVSRISVLPHFNYSAGYDGGGERAIERPGRPFALYAGRLEKNKGIFSLVQAFGASGHALKIAGTGNTEAELRKYCAERGYAEVEFLGHLAPEKLSGHFRNALFVVVPSVWYEVFGLAIIEAFNYAKPVVAADIGGIPEVVEDGKNGLLYRPGDREDLRGKVLWMFDNQEQAGQMGQYARRYVQQKFSPDSFWKELGSLHASLMTAGRLS